MKYFGAILGVVIAWAIGKWHPGFFPELLSVSGASAAFSGIAVILTATWAYALNKLTVFEKLEDLNAHQKKQVQIKAEYFRNIVIRSMIVNALLLVITIILIVLSAVPSTKLIGCYIGYWLCGTMVYLLVSFMESWDCFKAVEHSRAVLAEVQAENKVRAAYLKQIREDERKNPTDYQDAHLKSYTSDFVSDIDDSINPP